MIQVRLLAQKLISNDGIRLFENQMLGRASGNHLEADPSLATLTSPIQIPSALW
jgi:hypothetical protein